MLEIKNTIPENKNVFEDAFSRLVMAEKRILGFENYFHKTSNAKIKS